MIDLVIFLLGLIATPLIYITCGWVLSILWAWFIVPLGLPSITAPRATGLAIVVGFLTGHVQIKQCKDNRSRDEKREDGLSHILTAIASPLMALLIGWIVYQLVG